MTSENMCYWLTGYFELTDSGQGLSPQQVQIIKDHLELIFKKVTPNRTLMPLVGDITPNTPLLNNVTPFIYASC